MLGRLKPGFLVLALSTSILSLSLPLILSGTQTRASIKHIHKVGIANSSKRYLPLGLHVDDPPTGSRVDHPLASVSAPLTSYRRRLQDLLDSARDELAVQREALVRDNLGLLLALGLYVRAIFREDNSIGSAPSA